MLDSRSRLYVCCAETKSEAEIESKNTEIDF
jgi:hypothetical protein